ncbi:DNA internalization-related competence protein ComEC/Rec2 [candidate division KSB1 bacterium]|nr:DNA internalization-related competence protein ComEC/Rec2 [candidate division KSB1 bacterium]
MNDIFLCRYPAVKVILIMISGILFAAHIALSIKLLLIMICTLFFLILMHILIDRSNSRLIDYLIAGFIFLTSTFLYQAAESIFPSNHIKYFTGIEEDMLIHGYVSNHPVNKDTLLCCELETETIQLIGNDSITTTGKILFKSPSVSDRLKKGDFITVIGKLKQPPAERNPGEFDYRKYLKAQGIYGIISVFDSSKIILSNCTKEFPWWDEVLTASRRFLEDKIDSGFEGQNRALLKGLILGERGEILPEVKEAFGKTGVMHVLAVSGLHVGFIVLIFGGLFRLLFIPFRMASILTMFAALFYMALIGFKPPVVRATILVELYLLSTLLQRQANVYNLVSVAALIILLIDPIQLFQPSFQLSFVAVLAIIYFYRILKSTLEKFEFYRKAASIPLLNYVLELFLVSLAASCGTLPLTVYYFEKLPILSLFLNILVIPAVGLIIASGFIFILFAGIMWSVSEVLASGLQTVIDGLIRFIRMIADLPVSFVPVYQAELLHIIAAYIFLILVFNLNNSRVRRICATVFVAIILLISMESVAGSERCLEVTILDVGQGDASFIRFPNGTNMLIDGGDCTEYVNAGQRHVLPFLKRQGIGKIDILMLSHADNDHVGGLPYILRNIEVGRVIDSGREADHEFYRDYRHLIDSLKIDYQSMKACEVVLEARDLGVFVFNPKDSLQYDDINNASLVLKIIYGDVSFLYTGDIEEPAEEYLLCYRDALRCNVLKVAHHGSNTSSMDEFLHYANPEYAVISVGAYNRFNHPSERVIERLKKYGTKIIQTDENGAVIFKSDGKSLSRIR